MSRVRRGRRPAIGGVTTSGEARLHLQVAEPDLEEPFLGDTLEGEIWNLIAQDLRDSPPFRPSDGDDPDLPPIPECFETVLRLLAETDGAGRVGEIEREIAHQGLFVLDAIGETEPRWQVAIAAGFNNSFPELRNWYLRNWDFFSVCADWKKRHSSLPPDLESMLDDFAEHTTQPVWDSELKPDFSGLRLTESGPDWCTWPVRWLGDLQDNDLLPKIVDEEIDPNSATIALIKLMLDTSDTHLRVFEAVADDEVQISDTISSVLSELSDRSNLIYRNLLVDGPLLRCQVGHPDRWFHEQPLQWQALDHPTGKWVDLESLSSAQRRWARIAIHLSFNELTRNPDYVAEAIVCWMSLSKRCMCWPKDTWLTVLVGQRST